MNGGKKLMKSIKVCGDFDDNIYGEILSRLPVKSLCRFKCVCKGWQSFISDDNYFIDLHLSRKNTRSSPSTIFMVMLYTDGESTVVFVDLFNEAVPFIRSIIKLENDEHVLKPVNGLICSYQNDYLLGPTAVRIRNIMKQEETPCMVASIEELGKKNLFSQILVHGFGFDMTTKEHKVICVWQTEVYALDDAFCLEDVVCKVMTVGRKSYSAWRTIDDFPPYMIEYDGIFVNNSLYWLSRNTIPTSHCKNNKTFPPTKYIGSLFQVIVAFDLASEKFRSIPIPNFIMDQPINRRRWDLEFVHRFVYLLEVDGHIALTDQVNGQTVKLWILDEDGDSHKKIATNTTVASRDGNWIEEPILMPFSPSDMHRYLFESITGTDKLAIGISMLMVPTTLFTLYLYDRKDKTFNQVEINGMPRNVFSQADRMANFTESLLLILKKQQQQ